MIKKAFTTLGIVLLLSFASCGGGSSKEAKALLQKILQLVGIPQHVTVNICQDENKNGLCENFELQASININSGDDIDTIWQKITKDKDGRYFLETYDETLPILLEVQDTANLDFDDSKFTLTFNGFETKEENETKELSILESMVDANALSKDIADKFRTLNNEDAQNKYYSALFESLETNINTLRRENLDKEEAINATIKEMADETKTNQAQADKINSCENNQTCVDEEIKKVSDELVISDEEVVEIKGKQSNTNTSSDNKNDYSKYKGLPKDKEPFNRITIESDSCKNIVFSYLWMSIQPQEVQFLTEKYSDDVDLITTISLNVFCIDGNKESRVNSIKKASFKDINGKEYNMNMSPTIIHENRSYLYLDDYIIGNTEEIKYNSSVFYAKSNEDGIDFDRISIVSTSKECVNPKIVSLQISTRGHSDGLYTHFYPHVLCSNTEVEAKADLKYVDKSNNIHIFKDSEKLFSSFFKIKGNIEELRENAGYRNYEAIGFDNSDKDYYQYP